MNDPPNPHRGFARCRPKGGLKNVILKKLKIILKMSRLGMRLVTELKVPPGRFRGGFPAELESGNKETLGGFKV
jgi:hypothetical protein